jgi:hypothetical protein
VPICIYNLQQHEEEKSVPFLEKFLEDAMSIRLDLTADTKNLLHRTVRSLPLKAG